METTSENLRKNTFVCYNHGAEKRYRNILFGAQNGFTKEQDDSAVFAENRIASDMTRIRIGQPRDIDSIVAFNRAMAAETEQKQLSLPVLQAGVRAVFTNPQHGFYVIAETENEIIASLLVTREWSDWRSAAFWWVQSLYVRPKYRRKGVLRSMYQFIKEKAKREKGICGFRLYVEKNNTVARHCYEKLGMEKSRYTLYEDTQII